MRTAKASKTLTLCGLTVLILSVLCSSAAADLILQIDFSASGFTAFGSTPYTPPTDPVTGSFTILADEDDKSVLSVQSVSLTIDEHTYSVSDLVTHSGGSASYIGGKGFYGSSSPWSSVPAGQDDFKLKWLHTTEEFDLFHYSSSTSDGIFWTNTFSVSSSISTIPEPSSIALACIGIICGAGVAFRKRGTRPK